MSTYSQKIGSWMNSKTGCGLVDLCRKFGYPNRETMIMSLDETDERKSKLVIKKNAELLKLYLACSNSSKSISRKGENRSWTQYFKDLITGWILEDLTIEQFRNWGLDVKRNGQDAKRIIEVDGNVSQDADLVISVGDVSRRVELTNEFNSILKNDGFIEKRAPALFNLWKTKGIWIFRDVEHGKYILVDFATEKVTIHLRHHNTAGNWSKDVHRYILSENGKKERDERMLAAEVISVVGCSIEGKEQPPLVEIEDEDSPPQVFTIGGGFKKDSSNVEETSEEVNQKKTKESISLVKSKKVETTKAKAESVRQYVSKPVSSRVEVPSEEDEENNTSYDGVDLGDEDFV